MTQVDKAVEALNERGYNAREFLNRVYIQAWTTDLESSMEIPMHPEEVKHWAEVYDSKTIES